MVHHVGKDGGCSGSVMVGAGAEDIVEARREETAGARGEARL